MSNVFKIMGDKQFTTETFTMPLDLMREHEKQAIANHSQSIDRLNERGGLTVQEAYAVLHDRSYWSCEMIGREAMRNKLIRIAEDWALKGEVAG